MKHSSLCICAGALLIVAPMILLAYRAHELSVAMQSFAVNHYGGHLTWPPISLDWKLLSWGAGSMLVVYGIICGALEFKHDKDKATTGAEIVD